MYKGRKISKVSVIAGLCLAMAGVVSAQPACVTCPPDAQATAVGAGITVVRASDGSIVQPGQSVSECETLNVLASVAYSPQVLITTGNPPTPQLVTGSGFYGGTATISVNNGNPLSPFDVTSAEFGPTGTFKVGPAPCADATIRGMNNLAYTMTAADIAAGSVTFTFVYANGHSLLGDCSLLVGGNAQFQVAITPCVPQDLCHTAACVNGVCTQTAIPCLPIDACHTASCNPATGECVQTAIPCLPIDGCHTASCNPVTGECVQTEIPCLPQDICHTASCNPVTGECVQTPVGCNPAICVTKNVTCSPANATCDDSLTYGKTATGVEGATQPSFCYKIVVTNCGSDVLTNVTISDPDLPNITIKDTLAIGESVTIFASKTWPAAGSPHVNTVTVNGVGANSGTSVSQKDSATVSVLPISVSCSVTLLASDDLDSNLNDNHLTLPPTDAGTSIGGSPTTGFHLVVNNTGQGTVNVNVTDAFQGDVSLANCTVVDDTGTPVDPQPDLAAIPIPVGGHVNIICDIVLGPAACPGPDTITVTVVGTAVATAEVPCIFDSNGNPIQTAPSTCQGTIICQTPTTCRTTGGGDLYNGDQNTDCVTTTTVLSPSSTANGIPLDHTSHGGQMGAPYSHENCASLLADPCIRGQWQHNRHYVGKANPRDVFDADFHSATPKGLFDTLECACLGCCTGDTTKKGPKGLFAGLGQRFELCNPDDHISCGPMPRPAPANALIWSGMGTVKQVSDNNSGKGSEWVVLRVYIEDRSEPGGFHPGGSVDPADIYVFQAWKTGIPVATGAGKKGSDANNLGSAPGLGGMDVNVFRASLSDDSCAFIKSISVDGPCPPGSVPLDTVAGVTASVFDRGALRNGNRQIHPATGATCTAVGGIPQPEHTAPPVPNCQ